MCQGWQCVNVSSQLLYQARVQSKKAWRSAGLTAAGPLTVDVSSLDTKLVDSQGWQKAVGLQQHVWHGIEHMRWRIYGMQFQVARRRAWPLAVCQPLCVFVAVLVPLRTVQVSVAVVGMNCLPTDVSRIVQNAVVAIRLHG